MRTRTWWCLVGALLLSSNAVRAGEHGPDAGAAYPHGDQTAPIHGSLHVALPDFSEELADSAREPRFGEDWREAPRPSKVRGQNYEVPPVAFTGPLSHPRYEDGGFFTGLQFLYYRQTRPLRGQQVAVRGLIDVDGSINGSPGAFLGSKAEALSTDQLRGPGNFQPGFNLTLGWRFESGTVLQASWYHLVDSRYSATASLAPPNLFGQQFLEDTFLFSPVFNFPIDYAGNPQNTFTGNFGATFGIWNAASLMTIDFIQRFDMFDVTARIPMWQTDNYRMYGLVGPRVVALWERFRWRTVDADVTGLATADTTAIYSNVTSNRLYGVRCGTGHEWFLGDTPAGAFSFSVDMEAALYIDFVKGRAKYELGDRSTAATRARNMSALVPQVGAKLNLWYYPWEAIQVQVGYDMFAFFNTVSSPHPIDFNYGTLDPEWKHGTFRWMHGLSMGIGFVF